MNTKKNPSTERGASWCGLAENGSVTPLKFQEIMPVATVVKERTANVLSMRTSDTLII